MLEDANRLKNDPSLSPTISHGGATPLHVAASKNYLRVMKVLLSVTGMEKDAVDEDGWTPLHAAVYWGNIEAAEILVVYGADLHAITKANDTLDDLCDPEYVDDLENLKRIKEEQNSRHRRNAVIFRGRDRPSLSHSISKESDSNKHEKPSPGLVRRKSSKERFGKLDMGREKAEMENWSTESTEVNSIGGHKSDTIDLMEEVMRGREGRINGRETTSETADNNVKDSINSLKESTNNSVMNHQPTLPPVAKKPPSSSKSDSGHTHPPPSSSKSDSGHTHPPPSSSKSDSGHTHPPQSSSKSDSGHTHPPPSTPAIQKQPPTPVSRTDPDPVASEIHGRASPHHDLPLQIQQAPRAVSPLGSPQGSPKLQRNEPLSLPPQAAVSPLGSPQGSPQLQRKESPKTSPKIRESHSSPSKKKPSMSNQMMKRVTLWEQQSSSPTPRTSTPLASPQAVEGPKVPSTPEVKRYPFQPKTVSPKLGLGGRTMSVDSRPKGLDGLRKVVKRESYDETRFRASLHPPEEFPVRFSSLPRGAKIGADGVDHSTISPSEGKDVKLSKEVVSSEATPTPVVTTGEGREGEGTRHRRGESVESNISTASNRSISEDAELKRKVRSKRARETRKATQPVPTDILKQIHEHDSKEQAQEERGERRREGTSAKPEAESTRKSAHDEGVRQSAYRPPSRPSPRVSQATAPNPALLWTNTPEKRRSEELKERIEDKLSLATPITPSSDISDSDISRTPGDQSVASDLSPQLHPRTKSATRRRPRQQRRSTGITYEVDGDEEVPEGLENVVVRKGDSGSESSRSEDSLEELLQEEKARSQRLHDELSWMRAEMEKYRSRVSELNRRYEDVSRAYEQEKRERALREARIAELEEESKSLLDTKTENQRLKDENSALIRVIGKLSRAPLHA